MSSKFTILVDTFLIFQLFTTQLLLVKARSGWVHKKEDLQPKICYNPNNNLGFCVPIRDCAAFNYVVRHNLQANFKFFRASKCEGDAGSSPIICCNDDIHFKQRKSEKNLKLGRIIFPDELERNKTNERIENSESKNSNIEPSSTQRTILHKVEKTAVPVVTTSSEPTIMTTPTTMLNRTDVFPKPPKCGRLVVNNRIYGGKDAELLEFSWMVILEYRNLSTGQLSIDCAGSLINSKYVLTAAHCVQGDILKDYGKLESVRVGDHNTETEIDCIGMVCLKPFRRIAIESIIPHPNFTVNGYLGTRNHNDIALLRLKESVEFDDDIQPVCLPNIEMLKDLEDSTRFVVAGWGHNGTRVRTAVKQKLELPHVNREKCRKLYAKKFYLADEQICAGGQFRQDSCNGDSGGPLMRVNKAFLVIEGIVSFGLKCGLEQPAVYTNVRHYIDWINKNVEID